MMMNLLRVLRSKALRNALIVAALVVLVLYGYFSYPGDTAMVEVLGEEGKGFAYSDSTFAYRVFRHI